MTCPHCGGKLVVIDPNWSGCHQLVRCEDCGEEEERREWDLDGKAYRFWIKEGEDE